MRYSTTKCSQRRCQASWWLLGCAGHHAPQERDSGEAAHAAGACLGSTAKAGSKPFLLLESVSGLCTASVQAVEGKTVNSRSIFTAQSKRVSLEQRGDRLINSTTHTHALGRQWCNQNRITVVNTPTWKRESEGGRRRY